LAFSARFTAVLLWPMALSLPLAALLCGCGGNLQSTGVSLGGGSQTAPMASARGPQLGYIWISADRTLRPVLGVAGASQIGQSVVPAGMYVAGAASAVSRTAVLQEADGSLDIMAMPSGQPLHLAASLAADANIRFSPSGRSALLFNPGGSQLALVTALTSAPSVTALASPSPVVDAVVSDAGNVAVASSASTGVSIRLLTAKGAPQVDNVGALGGLTFSGADDLLIADAAANTLTLIRNASTAPTPSIAPTSGLLNKPSAVGVTAGSRWAVVANSGESSVVLVDLSGQAAPARIACGFAPSVVAPMAGDGVFRLTGLNSGPVWALDAGASTPHAFFIPGLPQPAATAKTKVAQR